MTEKAQFYWAVVGDGDPEPVGIKVVNGSRQAFTLGCADPYFIDGPECPCRLLPELTQAARNNRYIAKVEELPPEPLEVPENTLSPKVRRALEREFRRELAPKHSYAGFGRVASGMEAGTVETEGLDPKDDSPTASGGDAKPIVGRTT